MAINDQEISSTLSLAHESPTLNEKSPSDSPFPLTAIDLQLLAQSDSEFTPHSWSELRQIIAEDRLADLKRWPSAVRRYIAWSTDIKRKYESVPAYILAERLRWKSIDPSEPSPRFEVRNPVPFSDQADYKLLQNDWPYGNAEGISHIIVWLKTPLDVDAEGVLTQRGRDIVDRFVEKTFREPLGDNSRENNKVLWFKNSRSLQSVSALEHVHVLIRDAPIELLSKWMS
ncbi:hypothetical protein AOQ84DRAFT_301364 [Glonium stellatum]|uniref:N-acetylglucosamine-induced protein 1 n=1 Tax=Glonium stellatum TaxID=574774 RepID=A0A8E2JNZ5_9PEZI|nr:hypothetical protein AOQ84DRAFT_301364 [Glonium stellatum]